MNYSIINDVPKEMIHFTHSFLHLYYSNV